MTVLEQINLTFSALANPTRRAILAGLVGGEQTVTEVAAPFDFTLPAITKHLKVLERAGLIERGQKAQFRPCRLNAAPLEDASAWIESYRQYWDESLDRLDDYLQEIQSERKRHDGGRKQKDGE